MTSSNPEETLKFYILYSLQVLISCTVYYLEILFSDIHLLYYLNVASVIVLMMIYKFGNVYQWFIAIFNIFKSISLMIAYNGDSMNVIRMILISGLVELILTSAFILILHHTTLDTQQFAKNKSTDDCKQKVIPILLYKEINTEQTACSICLEEFTEISLVNKTKCSHVFHQKCIGNWSKRNQTCPNCRTVIQNT